MDIDGRNIFQWRREYIELSMEFTKYADHTPDCGTRTSLLHQHPEYVKVWRSVCVEAPCTCGVLVILSVMMHPTKFVYACPNAATPIRVHPSEFEVHIDADQNTPQTLWGIPVRLVPKQPVLGIDTDDPDRV